MLLYITLGTNNLAKATAFYDAVMATVGYARHVTMADEVGYGPVPASSERRKCQLYITEPYNKIPATWGNGTLAAVRAPSRAAVDAFHAAALAHGGFDEGAPGLRPYHPLFYGTYVRDPDGNKISAVYEGPE